MYITAQIIYTLLYSTHVLCDCHMHKLQHADADLPVPIHMNSILPHARCAHPYSTRVV